MFYCETGSTVAAYNLALEEALLEPNHDLVPSDGCFLLWQNAPSVIIGRHQNAFAEVHLGTLRRHRIALVRRMTGGGAVYHDLGNLNFTFIVPRRSRAEQTRTLLEPLIAYLASLNIPARLEGRNDLTIPGMGKCSGLASRYAHGKFLLHGTILFNVDLDMLERVLHVAPEKFQGKGVASVRTRVTNLKPHLSIAFDDFKAGIRDAYGFPRWNLPREIRAIAEKLAEEKYDRDDWNLGVSPPADLLLKRRFAFGSVELHLAIRHNKIDSARITGDFFFSGVSDETPRESGLEPLEHALRGLAADEPRAWAHAWKRFPLHDFFLGPPEEIEKIFQWLENAL